MRRCRFACVGALLLALLLTGCGKAGTAPEDGGADFSETEQVETPEAADALTVKEIAQVNEAFAPFKERENVSYVNSVCSFFPSYYERPEDLDLVEFLRYMGIGGTVEDEAEFQALKGPGAGPSRGWTPWTGCRCPSTGTGGRSWTRTWRSTPTSPRQT
ncbi:hypothetical protein [Oscillibacter sp.]|uniref:hypothetical protein n=1 Tax=Oscillibacter sp. TaxID=1945593 RepID=UPI002579996C|nr:hypothetical protein [Oscillibacter sp.]